MPNRVIEELEEILMEAVASLGELPHFSTRKMFGGVGAYIDGRIFATLSNVGLGLKLPPDAQEELLRVEGARRVQYEPDSPPSRHYIAMPSSILDEPDEVRAWVQRSAAYVQTLPPRQRRRAL